MEKAVTCISAKLKRPNIFFSEPPSYTTGSLHSHQRSTAANMLRFASFAVAAA